MTQARRQPPPAGDGCATMPPHFDRLNYFYGQLLGHRDFAIEQRFFREKMKLHNRCLHGHGVVCGLEVVPHGFDDSGREGDGDSSPRCRPRVLVECGLALDAEGNELVVRQALCVDLWEHLGDDDRRRVRRDGASTLYVSLCYSEVPIEPTRPVLPESCGPSGSRQYGKFRDSVCVRVSVERPVEDTRCEPCCTAPDGSCELLAKVTDFRPDDPSATIAVDDSVRRPVGPYRTTRVAGTSWAHAGSYRIQQAREILQVGLRVKFTGPVRAETIRPGVLDVFWIMGGGGVRGDVKHLPGQVYPCFLDDRQRPHGLRYDFGESAQECLSPNDRVMVVLRGAFVLDLCCQPVDGLHVGGWVPRLEDGNAPDHEPPGPPGGCAELRGSYGLWTSGQGQPGSSFESWFTVCDDRKPVPKPEPS